MLLGIMKMNIICGQIQRVVKLKLKLKIMSQDENQEVQEQPNALLIPMQLAQSLVNYLDGQKHGEVKNLIKGIESSKPVTVKQAGPEAEKVE